MSAITLLGLILFILMSIFGGKKGLISYLTLFLNFVILFISIILIIFGVPIYLVTLIFCIVIAACNLFVLNSYNTKKKAAFYVNDSHINRSYIFIRFNRTFTRVYNRTTGRNLYLFYEYRYRYGEIYGIYHRTCCDRRCY